MKKCYNIECNNSVLVVSNKYCSSSCAAIVNNKRRGKKCKLPTCQINVGRANKDFCSIVHRSEFLLLEKSLLALTTGKMPQSSFSCKTIIRHIRGWKCEVSGCGVSMWLGSEVSLILDHIDGNPYNHVYSNLRLVCGNCDMQLPTYKAKNKGNGRHSRRIRYLEGKSY